MRVAPYSRKNFTKLDGRSVEARALRDMRRELTTHIGGKPNTVQAAMIEQLVQLKLRLMIMDRAFAEAGQQTLHDSRSYLAWANTYGRMLVRLGVKGAPVARKTLAEYFAETETDKASA